MARGHYRRPRTAQEKRNECRYTRARRRARSLVDDWSGIGKQMQRTWKHYRHTQYKEATDV